MTERVEQPSWRSRGIHHPTSAVVLILIGLALFFGIYQFDHFTTTTNVRNIALGASEGLVLAVGMTFVIITAGIDLSIGSVLVFASVVSVKAMVAVGGDSWATVLLGVVVAVAAGALWGLVNGLLIAKARLSPLIVTLATSGIALGAAQIITKGFDETGVPPHLSSDIGQGLLAGVPYLTVIAIVVGLGGGVVLHLTRVGRHTYAIGSSPEAARRAGIRVERHLIKVYLIMGALSGVAAVMDLARFSTTTLNGHTTENLSAIAAVVLGGTSLFGGSGWMLGTAVGVLIPAVLLNGFVIVGIQSFWQQVAVGIVLIAAVYIDRLRRSRRT